MKTILGYSINKPRRRCFATLLIAGLLAAVGIPAVSAADQSGPQPMLTGTLQNAVTISIPFDLSFTRVHTYSVRLLDADTAEAEGFVIVQAQDAHDLKQLLGITGNPLHFVIDVDTMNIGPNGAVMCGTLNGESFGVPLVDIRVWHAVANSGMRGGEGDLSFAIWNFEEALATCGLYPATSDDINAQSIVDDLNFLMGAAVTLEQVTQERLHGNLQIHNAD